MNMNDELCDRMVGRARTALLLDHPFFGLLLLRRRIVITRQCPTAGADIEGTVYINPDWFVRLTHQQAVFILAHETMHVALLHWLRMNGRLLEPWNVACDKVINDLLTAERVGEPVPNGVYEVGARFKSAEELYDPNQQMQQGGIGTDMVGRMPTAAEASGIAAELQEELRQAATLAKARSKGRGKDFSNIDRLVKEVTEVKTPWFDILERWMVNVAYNDYSWSRPNRRYVGSDIYLPSLRSVGTMGPLAFVTDTSASLGDDDLADAGGHVSAILEQAMPEILYAIYCDARVNRVDEILPDDLPFVPKNVGGGGTSFKPPFKWLSDQGIKPDVLIYFTDLDGDFPAEEPDYPVIWLATTDRPAPWGEVLRFERDK